MSLDVTLLATKKVNVFDANITHNLTTMAAKAGIYKHLWRPEELDITIAAQLIKPLKIGLHRLQRDPEYFKQFNPENGWGTYEVFVSWVEKYLEACKENPDAEISICR